MPQHVSSSRASILVVDDEPTICEAVTTALADRYTMHAARCGADAVAVLRAHAIAGIILDAFLQHEHWLDLVPRFRQLSAARILVLTGQGSEALAARGIWTGVDGYLNKPVAIATLQAAIVQLLSAAVCHERAHRCRRQEAPLVGRAATAMCRGSRTRPRRRKPDASRAADTGPGRRAAGRDGPAGPRGSVDGGGRPPEDSGPVRPAGTADCSRRGPDRRPGRGRRAADTSDRHGRGGGAQVVRSSEVAQYPCALAAGGPWSSGRRPRERDNLPLTVCQIRHSLSLCLDPTSPWCGSTVW